MNVLNFADELRYHNKIFKVFELPFIPIIHALPYSIFEITLLTSPILFMSYHAIYKIKENKILFTYIILIFILLVLSEQTQARYYLDLYFLCVIIILININFYKKNFLNQ